MKGQKKGALTRWGEWQKGAWAGVAVESSEEFLVPYILMTRLSGIACPARNTVSGGACGAELWDLQITVACGSEGRRAVICQVCGWQSCRLLGVSLEGNDAHS